MTRRVAIAGVLAICFTALLVGGIAYVLVARDARTSENTVLRALSARPRTAFGPRDTFTELAQLRDRDGQVIRRTVALTELGTLPAASPGYTNIVLNGRHLRTRTVTVRRHLFTVAISDAPARSSLSDLRRGVLIAMVAGALLVSLVLVWITRRALAPVRDTASVAERIVSTGDLTARVPEPTGDDEIADLTASMNRMLTRLEVSDAALRRLVADASHELRSPITTLRGNLELLAARGVTEADRNEALADARTEAERLSRMVEELLSLARADAVNPDQPLLIADCVERALAGTGAALTAAPSDFTTLTVEGDPLTVQTMIHNLADNGDRYGGGAEVHVESDREWVTIRVVDHGAGIPSAERESVFGRFSRGSNASGLPGNGLGLAIVAAAAQSHGGDVWIEETPGGGATFVVRLPRGRSRRVG